MAKASILVAKKMHTEIEQLRKQIKHLRVMVTITTVCLVFLAASSFRGNPDKFDIIRAKGIVIEDSAGRDRILLGAPIPSSGYRVRTDTARVRQHWAGEFPSADEYMGYYKKYKHSAIGMIIMNENGFDRVLIGDQLADPNIGNRAFQMSGLVWNDKDGWERGGLGVNTLKDGRSRSIIGVDNNNGEAAHIHALEDGTSGISIGGEHGRLMLGYSPKDGMFFRNKADFTGIKLLDPQGKTSWEQKMNP